MVQEDTGMTFAEALKVLDRILGQVTVTRYNHDATEAWKVVKDKLESLENENQRLALQLMGDG
jgi:hypothetical protein